jgi:hypothetical protein
MQWSNPIGRLRAPRRGKALARIAFLLVVSTVVAALAAAFGIARDYGYLQASILTDLSGASTTHWARASPSGRDAGTALSP